MKVRMVKNTVRFAGLLIAALAALNLAPAIASDGKAKIVTGNSRPASCISPVHVNSIDGKQVYVAELGFDLDAGEHSLTGRALINAMNCPPTGRGSDRYKVEPLTHNFEAGKTYYVGYDHSSNNRRDWKLVIWKEEG